MWLCVQEMDGGKGRSPASSAVGLRVVVDGVRPVERNLGVVLVPLAEPDGVRGQRNAHPHTTRHDTNHTTNDTTRAGYILEGVHDAVGQAHGGGQVALMRVTL